jgi:hypothetical protein
MGEEKNNGVGDGNITFLSEYILDTKVFDSDNETGNIYAGSDIQQFLAGSFMDSFYGAEKDNSVMVLSNVETKTYALGSTAGDSLSTNDSTAEAQKVYLPWGLYEGKGSPYWLDSIFWSAKGVISNMETDNKNNSIYRLSDG